MLGVERYPCNGAGQREEWRQGIGFVLFVYGRRTGRWPQLVIGLVFMVYPYFTGGTTALAGVGLLLGGGLYLMIQAGW